MGAFHSQSRRGAGSSNDPSDELAESIRKLEIRPAIGFFNRKVELERLVKILAAQPLQINVLIGPKDSGKSTLLTHLESVWSSDPGRSVLAPMIIVDMRLHDCTTPDNMASVLKNAFFGWHSAVQSVLGSMGSMNVMGIPAGELTNLAKNFWEQVQGIGDKSGLAAIQEIIQGHLARYKGLKPIIIIDEANKLAKWEGKYDNELDDLLSFFEGITKQTRRAHIILASSDQFFRSWLRRKFSDGKIRPIGLGQFRENEAKEFFCNFCIPGSGLTLPENWEREIWPSIHQAAGGSPFYLETLVENAALEEDVESLKSGSLERIGLAKMSLDKFMTLGEEMGNDGWSRSDFVAIMKAIVKGEGAAECQQVINQVFHGDKTKAHLILLRLVRANAFHVLLVTKSTHYRDFDFKSTVPTEYIMATEPAAFAAMSKVLEE